MLGDSSRLGDTGNAAAIDIGTNSVKIVVGDRTSDGLLRVVADSVIISRLGERVDARGGLTSEAQERTIEAIRQLISLARSHGAGSLRLVTTSAMRDASNAAEFARSVESETGLKLQILSGEEEARLSYFAVASDPTFSSMPTKQAVLDIGGGSTELIFAESGRVVSVTSIDMGAVRLTERLLRENPPAPEEIEAARRQIGDSIRDTCNGREVDGLVGVGGTAVNLARMIHETPTARTHAVHGSEIDRRTLDRLTRMLGESTIAQRKQIIGLDPERADIILGGALILQGVVDALHTERMRISVRGLRYGVLFEMVGLA